jgi:hypothetical protein
MRLFSTTSPAHRAGSALLAAILLLGAVVPAGCSTQRAAGPVGEGLVAGKPLSIDYTESAAEAAVRLGAVLESATTAEEARPAVYEALARSGVAVKTLDGKSLAPTGGRDVSLFVFESQAENLTLDHIEHLGWTLADYTQALAECPEGPGKALLKEPTVIGRFLRQWALVAAQAPDDPGSFAPLLLAQIAKTRGGGSDWTTGTINPSRVELTYLEIMVLGAGYFASTGGVTGWLESAPTSGASLFDTLFGVERAYAADPCAWVEQTLGKAAQEFGKNGPEAAAEKASKKTAEWLTGKGLQYEAESMRMLGAAFKWTNLLVELIGLYGGYGIKVSWTPAKVHYLGLANGQVTHGDPELKVTAEVTRRPLAPDSLLGCLEWAGIEQPTAEDLKKCVLEWVFRYGTPKHAVLKQGTATPGNKQKLDAQGKAAITLDVASEKSKEAKDKGKLKKDRIVIQANLNTKAGDPVEILAKAVFGVGGGVGEVMKQWLTAWFPKRCTATIPVEWHELQRWRAVIPRKNGQWVLTSGPGAKSIWKATYEGDPVLTGTGAADLTSGSGTFRLKVVTSIPGAPTFRGNAEIPVKIGGTAEAPTLIFTGGTGDIAGIFTSGGGSLTVLLEPVPDTE